MESLALLIGGLGIGSLLTAFATHLMSRRAAIRDRRYAEKREAYSGLLNALHNAAGNPTEESVREYKTWRARCELFASKKVADRLDGYDTASSFSAEDAYNTYPLVVEDMRDDLENTK